MMVLGTYQCSPANISAAALATPSPDLLEGFTPTQLFKQPVRQEVVGETVKPQTCKDDDSDSFLSFSFE